MTEQKWLTSEDPAAMLEWFSVRDHPCEPWHVSERKLRLFACAMARLLPNPTRGATEAVEEAERFADGEPWPPPGPAEWIVQSADASRAAAGIIDYVGDLHVAERRPDRPTMAALLREIVGNPFRPVMLGKPDQQVKDDRVCEKCGQRFGSHPGRCTGCGSEFIRKWRWRDEAPWAFTPQVLSLAQAAYDDRLPDGTLDPFRLAVLADSLEEAGCGHAESVASVEKGIETLEFIMAMCTNDGSYREYQRNLDDHHRRLKEVREPHPVLAHLRSPGPHVRGCWALDLILRTLVR